MIAFGLVGFLAGIISGMGIGGGVLLIPALTMFFGYDQISAQSANLIYFIPTAITALMTHRKADRDFKLAAKISAGGIIGAITGSFLALKIDTGALTKAFGCFLLIMGLYEFFKKPEGETNGTSGVSSD